MSETPQYWFNTKTNSVEVGLKSLSMDRIGPFQTFDEAVRALEIIAARAREIEEQELLDD